ncbi:hypothetical protein PACTADRAFT_83262 [Pachysolen tannophilus NRRL Y-2460]|uniref:Holocytochrome c-type synthase n=1 Tax=Pachysolen tannophilus NRRL Y-2460 TaxID=669874 RepID=A0A1E4U1K0_PACTA|nr:hypothetical protein PACTADRAFT_83262 [Pachysolen tannophilus NRRL Y-2460]
MSKEEEQPKCPVDHSAREVWLKKQEEEEAASADKCPVDHTAREKWIQQMGNKPHIVTGQPEAIEVPKETAGQDSCSSEKLTDNPVLSSNVDLPMEREVSSIPRTGANSNWIYPSQKQFFEAMKRKEWNPDVKDMKTVVPIHNAVNERAWFYIQLWEKGQGAENCGGIKLTSFKGDSKKLTPRARWKLFLGYERPFDRHDWTIDRCGKQVDYVIDFYGGKTDPNNPQAASFYLDVRPKLNSFEGIKLRVLKALGF